MSANLTPKVDSSCNNWNCCRGSPKIKQSPKFPFGSLKSDEEIKVTTVYEKHRKPTPPVEEPKAPIASREIAFPTQGTPDS